MKQIQSRYKCIIYTIGFVILVINYMRLCFVTHDDFYEYFTNNVSETLVVGAVLADDVGVNDSKYGLSTYTDAAGYMTTYTDMIADRTADEWTYSDENVENGYSLDGSYIVVANTPYTGIYSDTETLVLFENGKILPIRDVTYDAGRRFIYFDSDSNLSKACGSVANIRYIDLEGNMMPKAAILEYKSQIGLQGKIASRLINNKSVPTIYAIVHIFCSIATALVFIIIIYFIEKIYNVEMALCWYFVFLFAPFVIYFARNIYWLEFMWFIPMLMGLIYVRFCENRGARITSYLCAMIVVMIKAACGYEYISAILIGMMIFPVEHLLNDCILDRAKSIKNKLIEFVRCSLLAFSGICGFVIAICWHGYYRGKGNIIEGLRNIYHEDILRSTLAKWDESYGEAYAGSMGESLASLLKRMFVGISTHVLPFISARYLLVIVALALISIVVLYRDKKSLMTKITILLLSCLAALSWFILAKSHSSMHPFSFVLFYMGFVQTCIYCIVDLLIKGYSHFCNLNKLRKEK